MSNQKPKTAAETKAVKKRANKAKKNNSTAKKIEQFVASFWMDGKEIQAQKPYKDKAMIEQDREVIAESKKVDIKKIEVHISDNRNKTEKKEAGEKPDDKKKASPPAPSVNPKEDPYAAMTPEMVVKKFIDISNKIEKHRRDEITMKADHAAERSDWQKSYNALHDELAKLAGIIESRQLDLFHNRPSQKPSEKKQSKKKRNSNEMSKQIMSEP